MNYRVEKHARSPVAKDRLGLRQLQSRPVLDKLHNYLLEIRGKYCRRVQRGARCAIPSRTG